jgi:hypothetical protein
VNNTPEVIGYTYHNPAISSACIAALQVIETTAVVDAGKWKLERAAAAIQRIIHEAFVDRFSETLTREDVEKQANPRNKDMVEQQAGRLLFSKLEKNTGGTPVYLSANTIADTGADPVSLSVGVGKVKYADGRPHWQRAFSRGNAANLADLGDVYVAPKLLGRSFHRKGIGLAIARTMLDYCPEDMPTIVYEFPKLEGGLPARLEEKGFRAHGSRAVQFCGIETEQVQYRGPLCGDLIEVLEAEQPWLTEREPITSPA